MVPEFWIIAGINGAGKTSFAQRPGVSDLLGPIPILNADDLTLDLLKRRRVASFADAQPGVLLQAFLDAAVETEERVKSALLEGRSVGVETVLSTDKFLKLVPEAQGRGFFVGLIYVALDTVETAIARIGTRVHAGGHGVPPDRVRERWGRSLDNLSRLAPMVDRLLVFDNSTIGTEAADLLVATGARGVVRILQPDLLPHVTAALRRAGAVVYGATSEP